MTECLKLNALTAGLIAALLGMAATGGARAAEDCADADGASFICGVNNVEDLQVLPGGQWIIGSDLAGPGNEGHFWLFSSDRKVRSIESAEIQIGSGAGDASCPGVPDWSVFEPHGLGLREINGKTVFIAINHGGRETLEFFDVGQGGSEPALTWTGCTKVPEGHWPDDVAVMPDGSLLVTSLWDPADETRVDKLVNGEPVGALLHWSPEAAWRVVPGYENVSGPNGIIASEDGENIHIAVWSGKKLLHTTAADLSVFTETPVDFPPDNLNWSQDGKSILVTGVNGTILEALQCFGSEKVNCPELGVRVDRYDLETKSFASEIAPGSYGVLGAATGAIEVGDSLWVSAFRADRVGVFPLN